MKLLHIVSSLDPTGGGPAESIRQCGLELALRGHAISVLTLDEPTAPFLSTYPFDVHALGPSIGGYRYNTRLVDWLKRHSGDFDAIVVNGLWQYHAFGAWRALRQTGHPYMVFPHGMLDPWFRRTYPLKHLKKRLYWPWADYRVLRDAQAVLFTCEEERLLARQSFSRYRANEAVVAFGTGQPPRADTGVSEFFLSRFPALRGQRLLLFLGRIQQKKGCDVLIEAFAQACRAQPDVRLVMAGPDAEGWQADLHALASRHGVADRITWTGMLTGDAKWGAFYASDAFVLPSHQENFGIAVAEALACGVPVLISDKVNIWREVHAAQAGLVSPDTVADTAAMLSAWTLLEAPARADMRRRAAALFQQRFTAAAMVDSLLAEIGRHRVRTVPVMA